MVSTVRALWLAGRAVTRRGLRVPQPSTLQVCQRSLCVIVRHHQAAGACRLRDVRGFASAGDVVTVKTPNFGAESITEGTLIEWSKKAGDGVAEGDILGMIETDKVSVEIKAPHSGVIQDLMAGIDDTVIVGQDLVSIKVGDVPKAVPKPTASEAPKTEAPTPAPVKAEQASVPAAAPVAASTTDNTRPERRQKLSRMRQRISVRLKESQNTCAMLTTFQEVDMSGIMMLRKEYKEQFEQRHGVKLGFMSAFAKASAFGLQQIPAINAVIDDTTNEIIYRDYVDISVAVSSPRGLVVPVLRNVESMSIQGIEAAIGDFAAQARNDTLSLEDMTGGTFTISNGGTFGSLMGTPIINLPQSAILGMHATKNRPVVLKNGEIGIRPIMYLALTYDHRLVDGREAVTFLCTIRDLVEDPRRLLLEV